MTSDKSDAITKSLDDLEQFLSRWNEHTLTHARGQAWDCATCKRASARLLVLSKALADAYDTDS